MPVPFVGGRARTYARKRTGSPGPGTDPNPPPPPPPATSGVFGGGAGEIFEDFGSGYDISGWINHLWDGNGSDKWQSYSHDPSGTGFVTIGPASPYDSNGNHIGVGLMSKPAGGGDKQGSLPHSMPNGSKASPTPCTSGRTPAPPAAARTTTPRASSTRCCGP